MQQKLKTKFLFKLTLIWLTILSQNNSLFAKTENKLEVFKIQNKDTIKVYMEIKFLKKGDFETILLLVEKKRYYYNYYYYSKDTFNHIKFIKKNKRIFHNNLIKNIIKLYNDKKCKFESLDYICIYTYEVALKEKICWNKGIN